MASKLIAERLLKFAKSPGAAHEVIRVGIGAPFDLSPTEAKDISAKSACEVYIGPLDVEPNRVYGADTIQALSIAVAEIDMFLVGLGRRGALFWASGEPYDAASSAPLPAGLSEAIRDAFGK